MFTTTSEVKTITGKIAKADLVERAQYVIEAYVGRIESEVSNENDLELLKRAVAYQTAYMLNNEDIVFEQMAVSTTGQNDAYTTFKANDKVSPFIAPMAVMVCNRLSFIKSRSIITGKIFQPNTAVSWVTL
jgi:hypothetical protein